MYKKINKQTFIDELPRLTCYSSDKIDWKNCIGKIVHFIYGDIEDSFEIISYNIKEQRVEIKYNNKTFIVTPNSIINGKLGQLFTNKSPTYLYNIGDVIVDSNRNMKIVDRYKNSKNIRCYKYICNICGWTEGNIVEPELKKGVKCSCCATRTIVVGINDITTTAPWMIPYFQGGFEEASLYSKCSNKKIIPICPDCKTVFNNTIAICRLYKNHGFSCPVCKDGYSYPEKFMYCLLKQIGYKFITQFSRKNAEWVGNYRYDFYIPDFNIIIETNGIQHYENSALFTLQRTFDDEIKNDNNKKELALKNNINYFVIDCRYSNVEWIKQSVLDSKLLELLKTCDSNIDWNECNNFATSNRCKEVCKIKSEHPEYTAKDISKITSISHSNVCNYLNRGTKLGWCYYNKNRNKRIRMLKNNI